MFPNAPGGDPYAAYGGAPPMMQGGYPPQQHHQYPPQQQYSMPPDQHWGGGGGGGGGYGQFPGQRSREGGLCNFFHKMGACRHGDGCNKLHVRPAVSPTLLLPMMYPNPRAIQHCTDELGRPMDIDFDDKYLKKHFERFYADVWQTVLEFGDVAEIRVCDNLCDHLLGNVYIRFVRESDAKTAMDGLKKKMYHEIVLLPEYSPVTDFTDACCKEDRDGECNRGSACNFLHIKRVSRSLMEKLERLAEKKRAKREKKNKRKRSRSESPEKDRPRDRERDRDRPREHRDRDRDRDRDRGDRGDYPARRRSPGVDSRLCHMCGNSGHISRDCPLKRAQ